ncbi:hypothetical protein pdam_00018312 [Pocillopora damicornis]|uniref:DNA endonuclease activator Ctp1 C-terminal domain-containing protein n=1 Tax=Pocillopora damicornis TaxID=46731 RepID=A0A3M6UA33_POCDA|nr:hypothetical protein pdam_00018312 [Pocillopora damicornis]
MESYSLLEKLKETIKRDFQDLSDRCTESDKRVQCLEKENTQIKEQLKQLQDENNHLKETLAKVEKELAYKDEKLKRKCDELHRKEQWWDQFRDETQRRFKAMKSYGTFPPHILEKYVNKDIFQELMNNNSTSSSLYKEDCLVINKRNGKLSTLKSRKKVRYNKVSASQSTAAEEVKTNSQDKDETHISETEEKEKLITDDDEVYPDTNESTKLYHHSPPDQRQGGNISAHPEVLVQETEDVYTEEVGDGFVDLSYTQPESPTIPSRTRSLQQDMNLTADCSVSLLPHGLKAEEKSEKQECKPNFDSKLVEDNVKTEIENEQMEKQPPPMKAASTCKSKSTKQTTLDTNFFSTKGALSKNDFTSGKRKRDTSGEFYDQKSHGKNEDFRDSEKEGLCLENDGKENFTGKNEKYSSKASQENRPKDTNECSKMGVRNNDAEPNYKYVEVVRKKDERAKLNGYKCRDCQEYYQGLDLPEDELKKRLKHCSRHRAKFSPPPSTPPGFWNLSFPDTQEYMAKGYLKTESEAPAPKRLRKTRRNRIAK